MKQKLLSLLTLLVCICATAWAETAIISPANMTSQGADGDRVAGNLWIGNGTALNSRFSIQITGNLGKGLTDQSTVKVGNTSYASFKNSNGAQNTITLPTGYKAKSVTFYVTANADADAKLQEFEGESLGENADAVTSHKDGDNPTVIAKTLNNPANAFTFTFGTKQVFFVAVVEYQLPQPDITTQPVSASYQKNATATALAVVAKASKGNLSYQWYSCDDANKTNAAAIDGQIDASYTPSTATVGTFYYFCRVTDDNGTTDSKVATITVSEATAPTIEISATATTVFSGNVVDLNATLTGVPTPTIQWYSNTTASTTGGTLIEGETNSSYSPATDVAGTYYYYAVASNSLGTATSNVITLTVNPLYSVTYTTGDETDVTGSVPASVDVESSVKLPINQTLFKEGYTLTGWNDGAKTYAPGASVPISANTTMTAVFTANTGELGVCPASVTWQFQTGQGAPSWATEGGAAFKYVAQMALGSENIDMPLTMDPSNGKIANGNWTDWTQMNGGTKLTAPVIEGTVLKLYVFQEGTTAVTFNGNAGSYNSNIYSYTATADDGKTGNIEIVIGDQSYTKYLTAYYPTAGFMLYDYATSVGTGATGNSDNVSSTTQSVNGSSVNVIKFGSSLNNSDHKTYYWKITPSAGTFQKGDRIIWTGCYSNSSEKTTTIVIYDNENISSAIVTGNSFANVNGGTAASPKPLTTGYFTLTADAEALYIGRSGGTTTYLTGLTVVRKNTIITPAYAKTTYVTTTPLDFSNVEGLTAYVATEAGGGSVKLDKVGAVPAGTPLLLEGTAGTEYTVPVVASAEAPAVNLFKAGDGVKEFDATDETSFDYILWSDGKFYRIETGTTVATTKAYLHCDSDPTGKSSARGLSVTYEDVELTGITNVNSSDNANSGVYYNLNGQRIGKPAKGMYIFNGKKYIAK